MGFGKLHSTLNKQWKMDSLLLFKDVYCKSQHLAGYAVASYLLTHFYNILIWWWWYQLVNWIGRALQMSMGKAILVAHTGIQSFRFQIRIDYKKIKAENGWDERKKNKVKFKRPQKRQIYWNGRYFIDSAVTDLETDASGVVFRKAHVADSDRVFSL